MITYNGYWFLWNIIGASQGSNGLKLDWEHKIDIPSFPFIAPKNGIAIVDYVYWPNYIHGSYAGIKINDVIVTCSYHDDTKAGIETMLPILVNKNDILNSFGVGAWKTSSSYFIPFK